MNEATHGIEIQSHSLDNDITREYFRKLILAGKEVGENAKIDVSVWNLPVSRTITTITTTSSRPGRCFLCCER